MNIFSRFLNTVRQFPDNAAVQADETVFTFADIHQSALAVAGRLGDCRGRHVGILAGNSPAFISGILGILGAGATAVPFNAMLTLPELLPQMQHADIAALCVSTPLQPLAEAAKQGGLACPIHILEEMAAQKGEAGAVTWGQGAAPGDLAMILYTSGTTGDPKGVMLTHRNLLANFESFAQMFSFRPSDTVVVVLPLFHCFSFTTQLLPCALIGCRMILCASFKPKQVLDIMSREPDVVFMGVPPMYALLAAAGSPDLDIKKNVRLAVSGGGPLPREVQRAFEECFRLDLQEGYGLTEAAPAVSFNLPGPANKRGTIGQSIPGIDLQVWDEDGRIVPLGAEGELVVRGENVMRGYYKNPAATAAAITAGGWLRTGDLATLDHEGYARIVGRKKELIVSAGENIHPREVEEVLASHPQVLEAAVIGIPHKRKTEVPKAFLVPQPGMPMAALDADEVRQFSRQRLAPHKIPHAWVVVESLPKTATGKVNKKLLA